MNDNRMKFYSTAVPGGRDRSAPRNPDKAPSNQQSFAPRHSTSLKSNNVGFPVINRRAVGVTGNQERTNEAIQTKNFHRPTSSAHKVRVIPLGGLEEVGKNMMAIEYGSDILIIDMGLSFPDEAMLGIDYVIPDIAYLEDKKDKIRGVIITHAHLDHFGAIPYLLPKLGYPPMYATRLTRGFIEKRLEEFGMVKDARLHTFTDKDVLRIGAFRLEFFHVNHNVPDGVGVAIFTPEGLLIHTGDFKFDLTPIGEDPFDFAKLAQLSSNKVLALFSDSTNAGVAGHSVSEKDIGENLDVIFTRAKGRLIVASFSSLIARMQQVFNSAVKHGRKVTVIGRSMEDNIEMARNLKYLTVPEGILIPVKHAMDLPDNQVIIMLTGSQGEEKSALARIARGEHKQISIKKGDTIILSSSPIPGNERSIISMMDELIRDGAKVYYSAIFGVHTGGHAKQEDLKLMLSLVRPKYFVPIHGERHMLSAHANIAEDIGIPTENIFVCDNGQVLEFVDNMARMSTEKIPVGYVMVDGLGVGDVGNVVIRDRQKMAEEGMFVVIATVERSTGRLVTSPDIISRGFIYMREATELVEEARELIKKILRLESGQQEHPANWAYIKEKIRDDVGQFLFEKTERRPLILPVIIEV